MAFSGALTLSDLNDFIAPSQACIKPVEEVKNQEEIAEPGGAVTQIRVDSTGSYYEVGSTKVNGSTGGRKLQQAQISLNDCLACSGCITSAESVLITMQSHEEVLSFLSSNPPATSPDYRTPVLSISPQSLASLAASTSSTSTHFVSPQTILHRVRAFCRQVLGIPYIFDTTFARHLSLLEQAREFKERKAAHGSENPQLPMLASACPGWVCYAEKAHAEMLPFISNTKSPQQVMGSLVKEWMGKKWGKRPDQIYHVSVMPCYDKKLEASRQDFFNDVYKTRDVDCVITTGELELLMKEKGWDLSARVECEDSSYMNGHAEDDVSLPELVSHPGTSSGSYLHSLIALVSSLPENKSRSLALTSRTIRSVDNEEFTLKDTATEEIIFKGAKCYGFRNLQNVVRKVGKENGVRGLPGGAVRGRAKRRAAGADGSMASQDKGYDFVEVMACPGGCVNGGGQMRPPLQDANRNVDVEGYARQWEAEGAGEIMGQGAMADPAAKWGNKEWIKRVEDVYWSEKVKTDAREMDKLAARILEDVCEPQMGDVEGDWMQSMDGDAEERRRKIFRTGYRKVESEIVGIAVKW